MATTTAPTPRSPHRSTSTSTPPPSAIRGLNEKVLAAAKQTGTVSIDTYEQTVNTVLDFSQKAADATKVDWVSALAKSQASIISRGDQHLHQGRSRPAEVIPSHVTPALPAVLKSTLFESRRNAGVRLCPPRRTPRARQSANDNRSPVRLGANQSMGVDLRWCDRIRRSGGGPEQDATGDGRGLGGVRPCRDARSLLQLDHRRTSMEPISRSEPAVPSWTSVRTFAIAEIRMIGDLLFGRR